MTTKRFRIGNDITIRWNVKKGGKDLNLRGRLVRLYMTHQRGKEALFDRFIPMDLESDEPVSLVEVVFEGMNQKVLGYYTLTIEVVSGLAGDNSRILIQDKCRAFELVGRSCEEESSDYLVEI